MTKKKKPATTKRLVIDVTAALHASVNRRAIDDDASIKDWVTDAINRKLNGATGTLAPLLSNLQPGERIAVKRYIDFIQKCPQGLRKAAIGLQKSIEEVHRELHK